MKVNLKIKKVVVTGTSLQGFVRGNLMYREMTGVDPDDSMLVLFSGGDGYQITLEDLTEGIQNYQTAVQYGTVSPEEFCVCWIFPLLNEVGDVIGLPAFMGQPETAAEDLDIRAASQIDPFFQNEQELGAFVYSYLRDLGADIWGDGLSQEQVAERMQELLTIIALYPENAGKPKAEWKLTKWQIRQFVYQNDDDFALQDADAETVELWKKYLDELVEEDDVNAVKIKGYAYYGGDNCVCPCNWEISKDCMLKLMEIAPDSLKALAANTLGYIFYYGRTNGGVPQYDEAYKYFSLAAFFGYYEAIYKVGDMLMSGKGTPKNKTAAFHLYQFVYDDCFPTFLQDEEGGAFADAALRMGGAFHKGNGVKADLMRAYEYYLQARLALDHRMANSHFFGNQTVSDRLDTSLAEIREELGSQCSQRTIEIRLLVLLQSLVFQNVDAVKIKVNRKKTETTIIWTRLKRAPWDPEPNVLLSVPELSLCRFTKEIKVSAPSDVPVEVISEEKPLYADKVKMKKNELHFYYKKKLVMSLGLGSWYLKAEKKKQ